MKKRLAILSLASAILLSLVLAACQSEYIIASPVTVSASAELTRNRNAKITDGSGAQVPAKAAETFDIPSLASTSYVDINKVTKVEFAYTLADDDWWLDYPQITFGIGVTVPLTVDAAHMLLPATKVGSFHGSTSGVLTVPYSKTGDGKITIAIGTGAGGASEAGHELDLDLKITGAKIYFE
jgi:hypothetical protein